MKFEGKHTDLVIVYCSFGSNLGDREAYLENAVYLLQNDDINIMRHSSLYETEPVGKTDQPAFLNAVVSFQTMLSPEAFLEHIFYTERELGRERREKWGPRTIDIDIILFGKETRSTPWLTIPHPRFAARKFVLVPLCEINPDLNLPGTATTVSELLESCEDQTNVIKYEPKKNNWPINY